MNEENKNNENNKKSNIITTIILILAIIGILFSGFNLFGIFGEYKEAEDEYIAVKKEYVQKVDFNDKDEKEKVPKREIDFKSLQEINPDIIGWIWLPDTEIDYPILQSSDNEDYLYTTFNGTSNSSGSIFVDFRNKGILNDNNTIVHGHNMKNGSMFHALNNYPDEEFFNKHKTFWIFTPDGKSKEFDIISLYVGNSKSNAYYIEGESLTYEEWLKDICFKSIHDTVDYDVI